ncbi:MAG: YegP family protein [Lachnospiraceae bacterium]|nr:YegP family protein [Lachnospiraceae bacterium]
MGKFVLSQTPNGYKFNLVAGNGEVIATSQVYKSVATAKKGIASVSATAPIAGIENQTEKDFKAVVNPKFEVYKDKKGEFRFRLKAKNGQIIATGEGYSKVDSCLKGIASVQKNAKEAKVEAKLEAKTEAKKK